MPFMTVTLTGTQNLVERIQAARAAMSAALLDAVTAACVDGVAMLAAAAPHGSGQGQPPEGDAPGPLSESFVSEVTASGTLIRAVIRTTQPTKLRYVRLGTGVYGPSGQRITPKAARALFWPGADHPVRSVSGMPPNDFVTPLLPAIQQQAAARVAEAGAAISATLNGA